MPKNPDISVICVYNRRDEVDRYLEVGLGRQDPARFERIYIDNTDGKYPSAATALNAAAERASGRYLMFVHQDVVFLEREWFSEAVMMLDSLDDLGIAGLAGISASDVAPVDRGRNEICQGDPPSRWIESTPITDPAVVESLDELCLIVPAPVFKIHKFDAETCPDWHLYGAELSLRIKYQTEYETYVLPGDIWHVSTGSIDTAYYSTLADVVEKHNYRTFIHLTTGNWPTVSLYIQAIVILSTVCDNVPGGATLRVVGRMVWGGLIPLIWEHKFEGIIALRKEMPARLERL